MADKEPRKRRKRRESQKREESEEVLLPPKEKHSHDRQQSEEPSSHDIGHEPSIFAKSVFFILFSLLIVAVGVIFFTLHGAQRVPWKSSEEPAVEVQSEIHEDSPSETVEHYVMHDDQDQSSQESSEYSEADEAPPLDPSEGHPWGEHLPQEKSEEQNIFSQLYDALGEEFFQDEDDDGHDDENEDEDKYEGEKLNDDDLEETSNQSGNDVQKDIMEETSKQALGNDDIKENLVNKNEPDNLEDQKNYLKNLEPDKEPPSVVSDNLLEVDEDEEDGPLSSDSFDVILEEVEIPQLLNVMEQSEDSSTDESIIKDNNAAVSKISDTPEPETVPYDTQEVSANSLLKEETTTTENEDLEGKVAKIVSASTDSLDENLDGDDDDDDDFWDLSLGEALSPEITASSTEPSRDINKRSSEESQQTESPGTGKHFAKESAINDLEDNRYIHDTEPDPVEKFVDEASNSLSSEEKLENEAAQDDPAENHQAPYENADVTNEYDFLFKEDIDEADKIIEKSPESALKMFETLTTKHPQSPRVIFGIAKALDKLAEVYRKNSYLDEAIQNYKKVLSLPSVRSTLYLKAGTRCVEQLRFRGLLGTAIKLQTQMIAKFPRNLDLRNQLAVSYLWTGNNSKAKEILNKVLAESPKNGFAKVHLAFILKVDEQKYLEAIPLFREGLSTREPGVIDGRFYFHYGDALARIGNKTQAWEVYEEGVKEGLFLSAYQRSLHNVETLTGKPWWSPQDTPYYSQLQMLERYWFVIREEALALLDDSKEHFIVHFDKLTDSGVWSQFELFARGKKIEKNCKRAPKTCSLFENITDATGCKRGQVKFSLIQPGTHIIAHSGPSNCRLRAHLGLVVPQGSRIRVANDTRHWIEGKFIVFDDSFEHEVWQDADTFRLVLIADFWHPELTAEQKATLSAI